MAAFSSKSSPLLGPYSHAGSLKNVSKSSPELQRPIPLDPVPENPVSDNPIHDDPASDDPSDDELVPGDPVHDGYVHEKLVPDDPVTDDPSDDELVPDDPVHDGYVHEKLVPDGSVPDDPVTDHPVCADSVHDNPVYGYSIHDDPSFEFQKLITFRKGYSWSHDTPEQWNLNTITLPICSKFTSIEDRLSTFKVCYTCEKFNPADLAAQGIYLDEAVPFKLKCFWCHQTVIFSKRSSTDLPHDTRSCFYYKLYCVEKECYQQYQGHSRSLPAESDHACTVCRKVPCFDFTFLEYTRNYRLWKECFVVLLLKLTAKILARRPPENVAGPSNTGESVPENMQHGTAQSIEIQTPEREAVYAQCQTVVTYILAAVII